MIDDPDQNELSNLRLCLLRPIQKKPVSNCHSQKDRKLVFNNIYRLIQAKSIAEMLQGEHSAILSTFIKLPFVIEIFVCLFDSLRPINNLSVKQGRVFLG